ncbi:hypothetical protein I302_105857 [Kwoniella bestiolae CBS 10118]|uniref:Uncharacterized protein n=1 Tax=Kwoniella bestiolae CBS 10118 TaxID=1296100 RepID=A0A1B9G2D3_9TREE|nr:hypothetical protein I302_04982 [Kwoniella bestiolae CBS 10118]OCF25171.1 hypothetical protein I302_04982 [Kwoniella bestiolae CBS 10118]
MRFSADWPPIKLHASSQLRDFLHGENLLSNVETICISGTPSDPIPIDPRVELVCQMCRPKKICVKWLHEDYNIQEIMDLLSHDDLKNIIIHGANKAFLPPARAYCVRMSLATSQNQLADQVMRVGAYAVIKASESLGSEECGVWRLVGSSREGSPVEDSQAIQEMLEDVEPLIDELPEDEWWEETLRQYEEERLGDAEGSEVGDDTGKEKEKTMSLKERARALMSVLSHTRTREEEENEPPCEVCGGE